MPHEVAFAMSVELPSDVFLSHSAKDKVVVRAVAERLRQDGLKVWFDEWVLKPSDNIPAKIEEGLEHQNLGFRISDFGFARLCMSANAFGSDWAQLDRHRGPRETAGCRRFDILRQMFPRCVRVERGVVDLKRLRLLDIAGRA